MTTLRIGLCRGRHDIKDITSYIFENTIEDITDLNSMYKSVEKTLKGQEKVDLYVTGLTVATTTVVKYCINNDIKLSLWHYNNANNDYFEQIIIE